MQSGNIATLLNRGQCEAALLVLRSSYPQLINELLDKYDIDELTQLACDLPYDPDAASCIFVRGRAIDKPFFVTHITRKQNLQSFPNMVLVLSVKWRQNLATYCAAAARHTMSKLLSEMLELERQRLALVKKAKGLLTAASGKGAVILEAALRSYTGKPNDAQADPEGVPQVPPEQPGPGDRPPS